MCVYYLCKKEERKFTFIQRTNALQYLEGLVTVVTVVNVHMLLGAE